MIPGLFSELLQACVAATLATLLLLALRRPLRRAFGAELAYRCWLLVPASMLAAWIPAPVPASPATGALAPQAQAATQWLAPIVANSPGSGTTAWLLLAWLSGTAALAASFIARQRRFTGRIERRPAEAFDLIDAGGPALVGMLRARVLVPRDFAQRYSQDEQELVIAHERAHAARGDLWAQALVLGLRCLFWFNPVLHLGARCFGFDQELACDEAVMRRHPNRRRAYADAMLKTQLSPLSLPVACHWHSRHPLKERIAMLKHTVSASRRRAGALVATGLLLAGSVAAWAAQPAALPAPMPSPEPAGEASPQAAPVPAPMITRIREGEDLSPPAYPKSALAKGVSGKVILEIVFAADGRAREAKAVSATPEGVFEQAAIDAAMHWHILPKYENGKPVEQTFRTQVEFKADR